MGVFSKFKKQREDIIDTEDTTLLGFDAITSECEKIYPGQKEPIHYETLIGWDFGGNAPLDAISVYDGGDYYHFVTYGLSELYDKKSEDKELSGYGMEFTFKLKKDNCDDGDAEIECICDILQSIARRTFTKGELFHAYEYLYLEQKQGIDVNKKSKIIGFITIPDLQFSILDTPNGKVHFVEFVGVTDSELQAIKNKQITVKELYEKLNSDVTDYYRDSII